MHIFSETNFRGVSESQCDTIRRQKDSLSLTLIAQSSVQLFLISGTDSFVSVCHTCDND